MRRRELLIGLGAAAAASGTLAPSRRRGGSGFSIRVSRVQLRCGCRFEAGLRPSNGGDPVILKGVADDR